jgi:hypothetical protein
MKNPLFSAAKVRPDLRTTKEKTSDTLNYYVSKTHAFVKVFSESIIKDLFERDKYILYILLLFNILFFFFL